MSFDEQEFIVDHFAAEGSKARLSGKPEQSCPYGVTMLMQRCAWLAGWWDEERGMA